MADSAMMSLNREMHPSFVGAYQDLHNSAVEIVKQGLSPVTKPLTSHIENISGTVKNFFEPVTKVVETVQKEITKFIENTIAEMIKKMGIQTGTNVATQEALNEAAQKTAQQVTEALGTAVAVVGYVYVAYQVAMLVIQTIYKCEEKEFELASNRDSAITWVLIAKARFLALVLKNVIAIAATNLRLDAFSKNKLEPSFTALRISGVPKILVVKGSLLQTLEK